MGLFKCACYIAAIGVVSFIIGRLMPASWFNEEAFPFTCCDWEKSGTVYNALEIRKWQNRLPDMSKIFPQLMQEKKISHNFQDELPIMIKETCIAEFIHVLLCLAGLYCIWLWPGFGGLTAAVINTLANIPFILIQRYNRPRLIGLQTKLSCRCH